MGRKTVYNDIVNEDEYSKVNEDNKELLEDFIEYLQSIGRAEGTVTNYTSDIRIYFIWNLRNNKNKPFYEITRRNIMRYQNWLMNDLKLSSNRIRRLRAAISSMSNYIESMLDEEFPNFRNIVGKIPAPALEPVREKTVFEDEDLEELLDILVEKDKVQEACALALAMYSGSRKAEITRFKVDFFVPENIVHGSLYRTPKIQTKGRGVNGKPLNKYVLANQFQPYLDMWLSRRKKLGIESEYLFVTQTGGEWSQAQVSLMDSWAETFNRYIDKHFYWHANRHFFTTSLAKANIPAEVIRQISGWDSIEMVKIYNDQGIDEELGKYFGEDGIKQVEEGNLSNL